MARGIPGRVFAVVFVLSLLAICALTFAIGARFQSLMNRLEAVRSLWPNASQELKRRYDRFAEELMDQPASDLIHSEIQDWKNEFDESSQFDRQSVAASQLEQQILRATGQSSWHASDFDEPAIRKLLVADQQRKQSQNSMIGWLTIQGLRLKLPPIFEPRP
jgi:hypothetical protein